MTALATKASSDLPHFLNNSSFLLVKAAMRHTSVQADKTSAQDTKQTHIYRLPDTAKQQPIFSNL
ncbi:hypothetical protein [Chlorobium sp. N1]|uniref:hypothetical protein n=1 Tax=Chlorobium sp. N1 TaxID=2491138 RepID=UPI0013F16645|nr:hypothetical protein [Chlorobium sp. N1]